MNSGAFAVLHLQTVFAVLYLQVTSTSKLLVKFILA